MGSVAFYWQDSREPLHELQLVQLKEGMVIKEATWWVEDEETKDIYAAKDEKTGGTLFGVSRRGRVACLISTTSLTPWFGNGPTPAELLPVMFLKGNMSPREFADELQSNKNLSSGLAFYLVVADIPSKSMLYISKRFSSGETVETRVVGPGFHCVAHEDGLDNSTCSRQKHLEHVLLNEITDKAFLDEVIGPEHLTSEEDNDQERRDYGATVVNITTGNIKFCETFQRNAAFEDRHEIDFDMD